MSVEAPEMPKQFQDRTGRPFTPGQTAEFTPEVQMPGGGLEEAEITKQHNAAQAGAAAQERYEERLEADYESRERPVAAQLADITSGQDPHAASKARQLRRQLPDELRKVDTGNGTYIVVDRGGNVVNQHDLRKGIRSLNEMVVEDAAQQRADLDATPESTAADKFASDEDRSWVREVYESAQVAPDTRLGLTGEEQGVYDTYVRLRQRERFADGDVRPGEERAALGYMAKTYGPDSDEARKLFARFGSKLSHKDYMTFSDRSQEAADARAHIESLSDKEVSLMSPEEIEATTRKFPHLRSVLAQKAEKVRASRAPIRELFPDDEPFAPAPQENNGRRLPDGTFAPSALVAEGPSQARSPWAAAAHAAGRFEGAGADELDFLSLAGSGAVHEGDVRVAGPESLPPLSAEPVSNPPRAEGNSPTSHPGGGASEHGPWRGSPEARPVREASIVPGMDRAPSERRGRGRVARRVGASLIAAAAAVAGIAGYEYGQHEVSSSRLPAAVAPANPGHKHPKREDEAQDKRASEARGSNESRVQAVVLPEYNPATGDGTIWKLVQDEFRAHGIDNPSNKEVYKRTKEVIKANRGHISWSNTRELPTGLPIIFPEWVSPKR